MSTQDFSALVARHRACFRTGATRSSERREGRLTALRAMLTDRAGGFYAARSTPTSATRRTAVRRPCWNGSLRNRVPTRRQGQGADLLRPFIRPFSRSLAAHPIQPLPPESPQAIPQAASRKAGETARLLDGAFPTEVAR